MASAWEFYETESTLLDVTVSKLAPGVTVTSPETGTYTSEDGNTVAEVTQYSITANSVASSHVYDLTDLHIIPPIDADGKMPDCRITLEVDGKPMNDVYLFDGSASANMLPPDNETVALRHVSLGDSYYQTMIKIAKGAVIANVPLRITGIKAVDSINVIVTSQAGWGQSGAAVTPLRVVGYGDDLTSAVLKSVEGVWTSTMRNGHRVNSVQLNVPPFPTYSLDYVGDGMPITLSNFNTLSGGNNQAGQKIYRFARYAYNASATVTSANFYPFTRKNELQGGPNQISNPYHDLGFDFRKTSDMLWVTELGYRFHESAAGISAYAAWYLDGDIAPRNTQNGTPISYNRNRLHYGSVQPLRPASNEYIALPEARKLMKVMLYKNTGVPVVSTMGSQSIPANGMSVALMGVKVQSS